MQNSSEAFLRNTPLVAVLNEMTGKDVIAATSDGRKYSGIFSAISDNMHLGMRCAYEVTDENKDNLLPRIREVKDKMMFEFKDVVSISFLSTEEKPNAQSMKFATDREYHVPPPTTNGHLDDDFQEWHGEEDEGFSPPVEEGFEPRPEEVQEKRVGRSAGRSNGWTPEEMFAQNKNLYQVESTYNENLSQYTTVQVEGTAEDRERAERLAREIEQNASSRFYANLENDDTERDLDKETQEQEFEPVGNQPGRKSQGSRGGFGARGGRGGLQNAGPGQINRRADALKNDRRNSGGAQGPANRNFSQVQQQQSQGTPSNSGPPSGYAAAAAKNSGGSRADRERDRRSQDEFREPQNPDWNMSKGKTFEGSNFKHQQKVMLEARSTPAATTGASANAAAPGGGNSVTSRGGAHEQTRGAPQGGGASQRVEDLKNWNNKFPISYHNNGNANNNNNSVNNNTQTAAAKVASKETTPSESPSPAATPSATPATTTRPGNAWTQGPPLSLVAHKNVASTSQNAVQTSSVAASASATITTATTTPSVGTSVPSTSTTPDAATYAATTSGAKDNAAASDASDDKKDAGKDDQNCGEDASDAASSTSTSTKKKSDFKFNINAPEFKPRPQTLVTQQPPQPQYHVPNHAMQQGPPQHMAMPHMQGQPIVPVAQVQGVQGQGIPAMMYWPNSPQGQPYSGYQMMPGQQLQMMPQGMPVQRGGSQYPTAGAPARRQQQNPTTMYMPQHGAWQNQMGQMVSVGQPQVQYMPAYHQYSAGGPAGPQYSTVPTSGAPQHPAGAGVPQPPPPSQQPGGPPPPPSTGGPPPPQQQPQQAPPPPQPTGAVVYQQAGGQRGAPYPGSMGYVMPANQRYGGPPQGGHDVHYQGGQGSQAGGPSGPNSQPPTPGPQPVTSPAQQQQQQQQQANLHGSSGSGSNGSLNGSNGRSGSPVLQQQQPQQQQQQQPQQVAQAQMMATHGMSMHVMPPPGQQQQPQAGHTFAMHPSQYQQMYGIFPSTMVYQQTTGPMPMGGHAPPHMDGQMMDGSGMMAQHPQHIMQDQYGGFISAAPHYYGQGPPSHAAQSMSQQQYNGQGTPPGMVQGQPGSQGAQQPPQMSAQQTAQ